MVRACALGWPVHFFAEKRNEPYKWYGDESITGKKCAGRQEYLNKSRLVLVLERCGA